MRRVAPHGCVSKDGAEVALPMADLRRARLVLTDALIAASAQMMKLNKTH